MNYLSDKHIVFIKDDLIDRGLTYLPLHEEVLDHVCCAIEYEMEQGQSFNQAYQSIIDSFGKEGFQTMQTETIQLLYSKSSKFMKTAILLVSMLFFGVMGSNSEFEPPSRSPLAGAPKVTGSFGMRMHPVNKVRKLHMGADFKCPMGTPILATSDGVVKKVAYDKTGYGKQIVLEHDESFQTRYAHLSELKVKVGQVIKKGEVIGLAGSTGSSAKPHLHYEVIKDGKRVDPADYL